MTGEMIVGRFAAQGSPSLELTWDGSSFRVGAEELPAGRVASLADAGYIEWAEGMAAWFAEERRTGRVPPLERSAAGGKADPVPRPRASRASRILVAAGTILMLFGCSIGFAGLLGSGSGAGGAMPPPGADGSVAPQAVWGGGAFLVAPVLYFAGKVLDRIQRRG